MATRSASTEVDEAVSCSNGNSDIIDVDGEVEGNADTGLVSLKGLPFKLIIKSYSLKTREFNKLINLLYRFINSSYGSNFGQLFANDSLITVMISVFLLV